MRINSLWIIIGLCLFAADITAANPLRLTEGEALTGRFTQCRYLSGFAKPVVSEGVFYLLPKATLIWQTEKPFKTRMVIDRAGITQSVAGSEVTSLSLAQFPGLEVLRDALDSALSGSWSSLEALSGAKMQRDGGKWRLRFTTSNADIRLPASSLDFEITDYLDRVEIVKKNGDRDVIIFFEQRRETTDAIRKEVQKDAESKS